MNSSIFRASKIIATETGIILVLFAIIFLFSGVISIYVRWGDVSNPVFNLILLIFGSSGVLIVALWRYKRKLPEISEWKTSIVQPTISKKIFLGILAGIILIALVYLHTFILYNLFGELYSTDARWDFVKDLSFSQKIVFLLAGAILAPLAEELYCREILFGSLLRAGFPITAFVFSSLTFAFLHFDLKNILAYFIYGAGFALLYKNTRSILTSVIAHMFINFILLSATLFTI